MSLIDLVLDSENHRININYGDESDVLLEWCVFICVYLFNSLMGTCDWISHLILNESYKAFDHPKNMNDDDNFVSRIYKLNTSQIASSL